MPIFSLPSPYGIGTLGSAAFDFVDFLTKGAQSFWQILPLNPTNYGDSPYQSFSCMAGNPYFIDLDLLVKDELLTKAEIKPYDFGTDSTKVDYEKLYNNRFKVLKAAFCNFKPNNEYRKFENQNAYWLDDYALFMAIKSANDGKAWYEWPEPLKKRDSKAILQTRENLAEEITFHKFLQFEFDKQWCSLKKYANQNNIQIIGDIPIYVALDSADVWSDPKQFLLDKDYKPKSVAGVPPDAFSADGQLWGNPLYDWNYIKQNNYAWWKQYLGHALKRYDKVRIDHFRGFESFFAIPYGDTDAKGGKWVKGPNIDLFDALKSEFGKNLPIIAEDLGVIDDGVRTLLKKTGYPGMKVFVFAFDGDPDNEYLPSNITNKNCVFYTGTHDNEPLRAFFESMEEETRKEFEKTLEDECLQADVPYITVTPEEECASIIELLMSTKADTVIIPMHDVLFMEEEARLNAPATVSGKNWTFRFTERDFGRRKAAWLKFLIEKYNR